nr:hypothetical protein [Tanacetum cinerariifolium]
APERGAGAATRRGLVQPAVFSERFVSPRGAELAAGLQRKPVLYQCLWRGHPRISAVYRVRGLPPRAKLLQDSLWPDQSVLKSQELAAPQLPPPSF